jgi:hypothetical protein
MALARRRKAFRKSLAETGYVEDRNVVVECRSAGGNDRLTALSNSARVRPASAVRLADRRARTTINGGNKSIELGLRSGLLFVAPLDFAKFARARNWPSMSALFLKDLPDQPPDRFRARGLILLCGYPLIQCGEIWRLQTNSYQCPLAGCRGATLFP